MKLSFFLHCSPFFYNLVLESLCLLSVRVQFAVCSRLPIYWILLYMLRSESLSLSVLEEFSATESLDGAREEPNRRCSFHIFILFLSLFFLFVCLFVSKSTLPRDADSLQIITKDQLYHHRKANNSGWRCE